MGAITASVALAMASAAAAPLHYHFEVGRAPGKIYNPWTLQDDRVELRSFRGDGIRDGDFVAPTIRVAPGQELAIDIANRLEPCTAEQRATQTCFNDTNLHTHGLWISPSGHSDNVLVSIAPGEDFQYRYEIPVDHPAGTYWYHPHRHGAGFAQVGSGMAGALIVTGNRLPTLTTPGDIDILLRDERGRAFPERVMIFQQMEYGCLDEKGVIEGERNKEGEPVRPFTCSPGKIGRIESFDNDWGWRFSGRFTGINGKVEPELGGAKAGTFERWRLINAGTGESMRMRLYRLDPAAPPLRKVRAEQQIAWRERYCVGQPLPMWQIAMDGLTRSSIRPTDEAVLFAGERTDLLIRLPAAGKYCMVNDTSRINLKRNNPPRMVALVEARGTAPVDVDAEAQLQSALIRSAETALGGTERAPIRDRVVSDLRDGLKLSSFTWHKPITEQEVSGYREVTLNIIEGPNAEIFHVNGRTYDHDRIDAVLPLGKAEEWRATSLIDDHPLHIHVNPFQIISIQDAEGRDVTDPKSAVFDPDYAGLKGQWKDTVFVKENVRIAFRTRYERFTGDFVTHCHIMYHGDHGMMQNLRIAAEGDEGPISHAAH
ncbi:multicopper oxidase family protein [Sphingomonas hankyongi]|uniref:Multicopper oxidase family protein n=1 Tax=Sphingomonas hankyongi TaxID=2908209 RepID=A0ABT0RZT0_9SPHN|nr:multicopper oxidase family protein [Sphingomonas hankyongi]MCL6728981.1 multicopper oxidase family protein [Sphingomonas hankyongi]